MAKETPINRMTLRELRHEYDYEFHDARGDQFSKLTDMGFLPPLDAEKTWGKRIYRAKLAAIRALPEDEWDDEFAKSWRNSVGSRNNPTKGRKAGYGKKHPGGSYAGLTSRMVRHNPQARENWATVAIQLGMAALPYIVSAFKKLSAKKLAQYQAMVAADDVAGQLKFIRRHSLMSPPVRVALANDRAAEWLRTNLNDALAQGAGEAALALSGAAADLGGAAVAAKHGAKTNPRQRPGLYLIYTPSGAVLEGHSGVVEHHFLEEYPDGSNFYGHTIYRIDWPRTAMGLLRAVSWIFGGSGALASDHLLYGVRPDGKEFELSIEDIERLARMRPDDARVDIKAQANPRARVYHIQPKPNMVAAQLEAQELGNILVGRGLATKAYASWSDERGGRYNFRTVKLALVGLPVERVQWDMSNDQYIRRAIDAHIGEVIGAYAGEARANSRARRRKTKKKTAPSRRSEVHRQHIEKAPKSGAQGTKKGKKGYQRRGKYQSRYNPSWEARSKYWPAGYDGTDPEQNAEIIEKWLSDAPSDWKSQFRQGMSERAATGQGSSRAMNLDNALKILGITAGGNRSSDAPMGRNRVPDDVRAAAMKGLALSWENNYGGWNFIGVARAMQLAVMPGVPAETLNRMSNFFGRNQRWKQSANFGDDDNPSRGYMAWLNWGGVEAEHWLQS